MLLNGASSYQGMLLVCIQIGSSTKSNIVRRTRTQLDLRQAVMKILHFKMFQFNMSVMSPTVTPARVVLEGALVCPPLRHSR
jgi:hypothetical protein